MAHASAQSLSASTSTDTLPPQPAIPKMSFASVAAKAAAPKLSNEPVASARLPENRPPIPIGPGKGKSSPTSSIGKDALEVLQESVAKLNVAGNPGPVIASADTDNEHMSTTLQNDDEKTHLSFVSNPTMSTDMRSIVSGTAFNMDEKESIRPDESASVKAADESDSVSGQGSGGPQSQVASEAGKDGFVDQFQEVSSAKKALPLTTTLVNRVPDDAGRNPIPTAIEFQPETPDVKLLDALDNPKDRIFLLQLEQQVITFIANPKEQALSLPPQNSFCRLLAHRLGDYYMLSHTADTSMGNVTLRKTETTRIPPSLKDLASPSTPESGAPPQAQPALKIMRRKAGGFGKEAGAGDDTVDSSAIQSQVGSDAGTSGIDLQRSPSKGTKQNMTREEREAHYQATRDRIFGDMEETKPSTETSTAASRASSATGGKTKKQKNRPKNDDFEPRSMFMNMAYPHQQQQGYVYTDRQQQAMYGYPPGVPNMPPHAMAGGYPDASMNQQQGFSQPPTHHVQMQPQQMQMQIQMQVPMGMPMQGYGQPNYSQQTMYNGAYGYPPQGQMMPPMTMQQPQQPYYTAHDQGSPYNNMMASPMMNSNQQSYAQGYQGWSPNMGVQYGGQDQSGYFPQNGPGGASNNTPPAGRYMSAEYPMSNPAHPVGHQHQQGQWNQWQAQPQEGQFPNAANVWQGGQPGMPGQAMQQNAMMQPQRMSPYQSPNQSSGKPNKKGGKGKNGGSELGKYDTSSLPPKPPAPVQGDQ